MKVHVSQLESAIMGAVRAINDACWRLRKAHGIQAELPGKIQITVEVVSDWNSIERETQDIAPELVTSVVSSTISEESPRTDVNTTNRGQEVTNSTSTPAGTRTQASASGGNTETEARNYQEFGS